MKRKTSLSAIAISIFISIASPSYSQWTPIPSPDPGNEMTLAVMDSALFSTVANHIFASTDTGETWSVIDSSETQGFLSLAVLQHNMFGGLLYYSPGSNPGGIVQSTSDGGNWKVDSGVINTSVYALAVKDTTIFAGTTAGLFRSDDLGATWVLVDTSLKNTYVPSLAVSGKVIVISNGSTLLRSVDGGEHWKTFTSNLTVNTWSLAFIGTNLFAGTQGTGVQRSLDSGLTWTPLNDGFSNGNNTAVRAIAVFDSSMFVVTVDGMYRRPLSETVMYAPEQQPSIPERFDLKQNYPNPFNPSTVIIYQLAINSYVTLKVYDILGREAAVLVDEQKQAGNYHVTFDGSRLASGVYFCRLEAGGFAGTKKLLLVK
jgi:hypothetical protein